MANYKFLAFGVVRSSNDSYAISDVTKALNNMPSVTNVEVQIVPEHELCKGSERPASTVTVASDVDHPYNTGKCSSCGGRVPLLSAGNFEVIRHFAPSNYPTKEA